VEKGAPWLALEYCPGEALEALPPALRLRLAEEAEAEGRRLEEGWAGVDDRVTSRGRAANTSAPAAAMAEASLAAAAAIAEAAADA
jgi:hypothetical protein